MRNLQVFSSSFSLLFSKDSLGWEFWGRHCWSLVEVVVSCLPWTGTTWCTVGDVSFWGGYLWGATATVGWRRQRQHHARSFNQVSAKQQKEHVPGRGQQRDSAFSSNHHLGCNLKTQMGHVVVNQRLDPNLLWKLEFEGPTLKSGRAQKKMKWRFKACAAFLSS